MNQWRDKKEFKARVHEWAKKLDVQVQVISLRAMKHKRASYTITNHLLIFNIELLNLDKEVGDYVIVHELLHFQAPNHGKLWKSLMRAYLGEYEELEVRLKQVEKK